MATVAVLKIPAADLYLVVPFRAFYSAKAERSTQILSGEACCIQSVDVATPIGTKNKLTDID